MFKNSRISFKEFFGSIFKNIFLSFAPHKAFKRAKHLQIIFSNVHSLIFSSSIPTKVFESVLKIIFIMYTPGKLRNKPNRFKEFFREYIQDDSSKKSALMKSFEQHQGKVLIFRHQRKLENCIQRSFFMENPN